MIKEKTKITFTHIETVSHGYLKVSLYDLIGFGFDMEKDFTNFWNQYKIHAACSKLYK